MGGKARSRERASRCLQLYLVLCALLVLVAGRLVQLQVMDARAYAAMAEDQRTRDIQLSPQRGAIYDREGEPLAVSVEARTVYATPYMVEDPKGAARALVSVLGGRTRDYEKKLRKDSGFVYLARKVDLDRARALERLDIAGIDFLQDSRRTYPSGQLACQVLGFVGVDDEGLAGLELQYDDLLGGRPGRLLAERDPYGRPIPGGVKESEEPVDGCSVMLTIDADIQYETQLQLAKTVRAHQAKSGTALVMDPRDGSILAMASYPGFDPNSYGKAKQRAVRNKAVTDAYEPGSTMKAITAAAVLDEGLLEPDSELQLPPTVTVGGRTIHESHPRGAVSWTLAEIVEKSSNVGAVKLGQRLGKRRLERYLRAFGMGAPTGIDFPGEAAGWLPPGKVWSSSTIGNVPFGQGVSTTPLQLARAVAAIANGGELVQPYLLAEVPSKPLKRPERTRTRVISAKASEQMVDVLRGVVTEGTGDQAAVEGYDVAGKTGTAQKALSGGRGYGNGKYVASFVGFLPAADPQVLVLVTIDEPTAGYYGGSVAAPAFSRIAQFAVAHLRVPPTGEKSAGSKASESGKAASGGQDDEGVTP